MEHGRAAEQRSSSQRVILAPGTTTLQIPVGLAVSEHEGLFRITISITLLLWIPEAAHELKFCPRVLCRHAGRGFIGGPLSPLFRDMLTAGGGAWVRM